MPIRKQKTKRERLSERLCKLFTEEHGLQIKDVRLYPNQGFWRTRGIEVDVQPWSGSALIKDDGWTNWMRINVGSDYTMTVLLKFGFRIEWSGLGIDLIIIPPDAPAQQQGEG